VENGGAEDDKEVEAESEGEASSGTLFVRLVILMRKLK